MDTTDGIEALARSRLRGVRVARGWSLDDLAARSHLSASTISRIETGKRTMSIEVLVALASALEVDVGSLLELHRGDDDVVIRPTPSRRNDATVWRLSQPASRTIVMKMRLEPTVDPRAPKVHPGSDWFYVLSGRIRLNLGAREIVVEPGEAAEFSTMTPHAFGAIGEPAELLMVFEADGRRAHLHTDEPE
jgi:transcriptional regulator with XRE-family HTH domain